MRGLGGSIYLRRITAANSAHSPRAFASSRSKALAGERVGRHPRRRWMHRTHWRVRRGFKSQRLAHHRTGNRRKSRSPRSPHLTKDMVRVRIEALRYARDRESHLVCAARRARTSTADKGVTDSASEEGRLIRSVGQYRNNSILATAQRRRIDSRQVQILAF
jgi:hypothetical protein